MSTTSAGMPPVFHPPTPAGESLAGFLVRGAADAIVALDADSRLRALNPAAERLFGGTVAELLGRSLTELMPDEMGQRHRLAMERYLAAESRPESWESTDGVVLRLDTGVHVPVTISFADHEEDGERLFVAVLRNRTEQQRQANALQAALAALGESERRTATILESLPVGVVVTDAVGIMTYTNPAAVALGIETPRDDNGDALPYFTAFTCTGEPYPVSWRPLARALKGGTGEADDLFVHGPGGEEIPIDCRATPLHNDDGAIVGAVAVVRDLRSERAAQAALRESEARYRDLVEHSGEILTSHALDGRLLSVNPAMLRSLRMRSKREVPRNLGDLVPVHHQAGFQEYLARVRREGRADGVGTVLASDGTRRVWQFHSSIRREGVAEPVVRSIVTDVTDARARERLLADQETRLRHAQKIEAVGKLAGGIAHDFNNILTVIAGHLALANDEGHLLPVQARADLEEVTRAVDRATRLTRRLLGFSRKQLLAPRVVDVNMLIAELEPMLARVLDERIAFAAHPSPTPARINIDPSVLEGALVNLAVNARDAMPNGGTLTVHTAVRGEMVTIAVRDSGTGMDPETLARVGEPFFTTKGAGVGTGLGLAMIYGSVEQSGGSIQIESTPGAGTVVRLLFPLAGEADATATEHTMPELDAAHGAPPNVRPVSVLVVEDEDPLRRLLERILVREGYHVTLARHGADALHIASTLEHPIELVITDLVMPELGGREVAEALRATNPSLPVLFISGYDPDPVVLGTSDHVSTAFLAKPFT
ncbi:MAG: domain S-box protein, partial [Geminicoccaceae bacterium]|nr:domain S-box protein [Geminicoccaceae bacterium]